MLYIKRLDGSKVSELTGADKAIVSEQVIVKISRLGFSLGYQALGRAEWESFAPAHVSEEEKQNGACFAAVSDDIIIGTVRVMPSDYGWAEITDIRVDPAFRRNGAGKVLLDACESWGIEHGCVGLRLKTSDRNPVVCQFLEHCGFQLGGVDRMAMMLLPEERDKPVANRPCGLLFYRKNR